MFALARRMLGATTMIGAMAVVAGAAALSGSTASAASLPARPVTCNMIDGIPVALGPGEPQTYNIVGELCATPSELASGETVQLLIHGATYNHSYWDFGTIDGMSYSYARDIAAAGFPTFAIDEIGAGQSSHPPSTDVTIQAAAYVAHEVVQDLLAGAIGHTRFGRVIEVGHSFGSLTTWLEASTYHDVAGAIITGAVHASSVFAANAASDVYPAIDDPLFADSGFDPGYLTTLPGTRGTLFYNSADSDPNVIAKDEATKDVISSTEFVAGLALETSAVSEGIDVPVLVIEGGQDKLFCGAETNGATFSCASGTEVANEEAPFYSPSAQMHACVVPSSGHDVNLALNHDLEEADVIAWSYEYVGQEGVPTIPLRLLPPDCSS